MLNMLKSETCKKNMHVKYKQDNLHRMTWYTGTYGIMAMGLLYMLALLSKVCIVWALDLIIVCGWCCLKGWSLQDEHH
jgi:hypothetical protein